MLHRDLKPANVMLGKFGETLVVDWGLAKAGIEPKGQGPDTDGATTDAGAAARLRQRPAGHAGRSALGTPAYMSPEQAAGRLDELSPASDIYSLGATLYVLLTGRPPYEGIDKANIVALVREGQFAAPRQARPDTPHALDAICRKAMALEPSDRYPTALDLAADVEHWLGDEPVAAYADPWAARVVRWARRHRTAVVAAGVFLASAVVALSVSTALVWREQQKTAAKEQFAEDERARAEHNYEVARTLSLDLIDIAESGLAPIRESEGVRKSLLTAVLRTHQQFLEQHPDDPELRKRAAQLYRYQANLQRLVRETAAAEQSYQESIRIQEALVEQYGDEPYYREKLSETLRDYADLHRRLGWLRAATETLHRSAEIADGLLGADPDRPRYRRLLAGALLDLSRVQKARGMAAESGQTAARAVGLFRGLLDVAPADRYVYDPLLLAASLAGLAIAEREQDHLKPALAAHREAIELLRGMLAGAVGNSNEVLHFLQRCVVELSRTQTRIPANRANAEKNLGQAVLWWEGMIKLHPQIAMYRESQAVAFQVRGQLRAELIRPAEARLDFEKARELLEKLADQFPESADYRGQLGRTYAALGRLSRDAGDPAGAAQWFAKAADALRKAVEQSPDDAGDKRSLDEVLAEQPK